MQIVDTSEKAFRAWLLKHAFEHVGTRSDPHGCAYARFLRDIGFVDAAVGMGAINTLTRLDMGIEVRQVQKTPHWLSEFIRKFDGRDEKGEKIGGRYTSSSVTGAEALKYLEEA